MRKFAVLLLVVSLTPAMAGVVLTPAQCRVEAGCEAAYISCRNNCNGCGNQASACRDACDVDYRRCANGIPYHIVNNGGGMGLPSLQAPQSTPSPE